MEQCAETIRVDTFVQQMPPFEISPEDFANHAALVRATLRVRSLMTAWATFARELEQELNQSVPKEWATNSQVASERLRSAVRDIEKQTRDGSLTIREVHDIAAAALAGAKP